MPARMTQEQFVIKANKRHNNKYDYSKAVYICYDSLITIGCSIHGDFILPAYRHLSKNGCPACGKENRKKALTKSSQDFIEDCIAKHGDKYDYSKVVYTNAHNKVIIICPIHGEFMQEPHDHQSGHGCMQCGRTITINATTMSFNQFIQLANEIHNDKYQYYQVEKFNGEIITIHCSIHGDFAQRRDVHLRGHGCQECGQEKVARALSSNAREFIAAAIKIHGHRYDYSLVKYVGNKQKVDIICSIHGIFSQTPNSHLQDAGCPECGTISAAKARLWDKEEFIKRAHIQHNNKYNYSLVDYTGSHKYITIICPDHGKFVQKSYCHIQGQGCPICVNRISEGEIRWLASLNIPHLITSPQHCIMYGKTRYYVDGFDPITNTIYEFNGDFWHGNPRLYKSNDINPRSQKTFGDLYKKTLLKESRLKKLGYNVISIWEGDFETI
jgi:hypothetical protein